MDGRGGGPSFRKGDRRVCSNYRGGNVILSGCGTVEQLYNLSRVQEGAWEFAQPVHMCFVILEKAFDRIPRGIPKGVLRDYGVSYTGGPLPISLESEFGPQSRTGCLFGDLRIGSMLFADDVVPFALSVRDLQLSLDRLAAKMKISTSKSEAMVLRRKKMECLPRVRKEILPLVEEFKYLGVLFTTEGKMERGDRQADLCGGRSNVGSAAVRRGEQDTEPKGTDFNLPVDLHSYPHLWSRALGSDPKNEIAGTSG